MRAPMLILAAAATALSACGGGGGGRVSGELGNACMAANRSAASPQLCSCVQQAANGSLTAGEQRRAAAFFADPHRAQVTRQSDNSGDEVFWQRYRAFVARAESMCR